MSFKKLTLILVIQTSLSFSFAQASSILMVGLNEKGETLEIDVPADKYKENFKKAIVGVEMSALPTLQKRSDSNKGWMLRTAVLGIGVNLEIGIGEFKLGVLPRFRIGFSNAKEPSVP